MKVIKMLIISLSIPLLILSCGSDRVNLEFKTSREIYIDDSKTDPDKFNKELESDLRASEKKRRQKEREADAAKAEAEQKAKANQTTKGQESEEVAQPHLKNN